MNRVPQEGDMIIFTGVSDADLTNGETYEVQSVYTHPSDEGLSYASVIDEAGDYNEIYFADLEFADGKDRISQVEGLLKQAKNSLAVITDQLSKHNKVTTSLKEDQKELKQVIRALENI